MEIENFNPLRIFKSFYQLKGRIQMSVYVIHYVLVNLAQLIL